MKEIKGVTKLIR